MTVAIGTYAQLLTEGQDWLFGRADIVSKLPTFVRMFEAKANRTLKCRQMEQRSSAPIDLTTAEPEFITLPGDFHSMRKVRMSSELGKPRLKYATGAQMDDLRERNGNVTGTPIWFTIAGEEMELCPTPSSALTVEMTYRKYLPALSDSNQQNWLLDMAPDAYLYGMLMEAAPYLHEDERIQVWASGVQGAVEQLNSLSDEALYNAGPLVMRRKGRAY